MPNLKDKMKEKGKKALKPFSPEMESPKGKVPKTPGRELLNNAMATLFIFLVLMTLYSFIANDKKEDGEIPISEVAADIERGDVSEIKIMLNLLNNYITTIIKN